MEILADQEWERCWLEHFRPMRFGTRLWVCPRGQQVDDPEATIITLDPGLAFGTGTHPTTALCLSWLSEASLMQKSVIDFGCGSGILAIAALKLGADKAFGIDHDPQAIRASQDNAEENGVAAQLYLSGANDTLPPPAQILVANILSGTLIRLRDELSRLVLPAGDLLLSGILTGQMDAVMQAFSTQFRFGPPRIQEDWVLLHGVRIG
jgi:ribosomal protein L11 methyltransferase